ncbi:MAG: CcmD family protein [Dehalococcoidia bacterium]|nr:CcmD family protein [Dehalococcoidia bacterium]MDW8120159.1 CcmD family protein [Chloroflexota bacterium]
MPLRPRMPMSIVGGLVPIGWLKVFSPPQQAPGQSALPYLFVAFALVWIVFFGYLLYLARRQADLSRDVEQIRRSTTPKDKE